MCGSDSDVEIVGISQDVNILPADLAHLLSACSKHAVPVVMSSVAATPPCAEPVSLAAYSNIKETERERLRCLVQSGSKPDGPLSVVAELLQGTEYKPSVLSPRISWLSDTAINGFIALMYSQLPASRAERVHIFNTFFFTKLYSSHQQSKPQAAADYMAVRRWTKTNPLGSKDLLVVPVHENAVHWCLMAVHVPSKKIYYLDSMFEHAQYFDEERARTLIRALFEWVLLEAHDKKCWGRVMQSPSATACAPQTAQQVAASHAHSTGSCPVQCAGPLSVEPLQAALPAIHLGKLQGSQSRHAGATALEASAAAQQQSMAPLEGAKLDMWGGWQGVLVRNVPRQTDVSSCGVFTATFAELLVRGFGPPFSFQMEDVAKIRVGMAHLLMQGHETGTYGMSQAVHVASQPWL